MEFNAAFDPFRALAAAWRALKQAPLPLLLGGILLTVTGGGGGGGAGFNPGSLDRGGDVDWDVLLPVIVAIGVFSCFLGIAFFLFSSWIEIGFQNAVEQVLRTGKGDAGTVFDARGRFWDMVLARLFATLLTVAAAVPLILVVAASVIAATQGWVDDEFAIAGGVVAGLVCFAVLVYVSLGLSLVTQAVALENHRPVQALGRSWSLARGHRWRLLLYFIVLGIVTVAGVCLCCVGVFLTGPLARIAVVESYLTCVRSGDRPGWWIETQQLAIAAQPDTWGSTPPPPPPPPPPVTPGRQP